MNLLRLIAGAVALAICAGSTPAHAAIPDWGGFSCDFVVSGAVPVSQLPPAVERDRMYMARSAVSPVRAPM